MHQIIFHCLIRTKSHKVIIAFVNLLCFHVLNACAPSWEGFWQVHSNKTNQCLWKEKERLCNPIENEEQNVSLWFIQENEPQIYLSKSSESTIIGSLTDSILIFEDGFVRQNSETLCTYFEQYSITFDTKQYTGTQTLIQYHDKSLESRCEIIPSGTETVWSLQYISTGAP